MGLNSWFGFTMNTNKNFTALDILKEKYIGQDVEVWHYPNNPDWNALFQYDTRCVMVVWRCIDVYLCRDEQTYEYMCYRLKFDNGLECSLYFE